MRYLRIRSARNEAKVFEWRGAIAGGKHPKGANVRYVQAAAGCLLLCSGLSHASSGALDADGCHTDPKTKVRHCHVSANERLVSASTATIDIDAKATDAKNDDDLYLDCKEVRAMGAAPLRIGDIGYSQRLDPDGDGVACE